MKKETTLKNKIEYWRKHQELDKFNINKDTSLYIGHISWIIAIFILIIGLINIIFLIFSFNIKILFIVIIITIIFIIAYFVFDYTRNKRGYWYSKIENHNRSFRIREAMLRAWYSKKEIGVDTDKLDIIFEEIKKKYNRKMSNKELENIAKKEIEKD